MFMQDCPQCLSKEFGVWLLCCSCCVSFVFFGFLLILKSLGKDFEGLGKYYCRCSLGTILISNSVQV